MSRPCYSRLYNISDENFRKFVRESETYTHVLKACGEEYKNINTVKRRISLMGIDASHIKNGSGHNRGKKYPEKSVSLNEILTNRLIENSKWTRQSIKRGIIKYEIIPYKCECGIENTWRNKLISLQLEHKNGNPNDSRIENLCFLCPNCHSQTRTFGGKKNRKLDIAL